MSILVDEGKISWKDCQQLVGFEKKTGSMYAKRLEFNEKNADSVTVNVWKTVAAAKKIKINQQDYIGIYQDYCFGKNRNLHKRKSIVV